MITLIHYSYMSHTAEASIYEKLQFLQTEHCMDTHEIIQNFNLIYFSREEDLAINFNPIRHTTIKILQGRIIYRELQNKIQDRWTTLKSQKI